MKSDFKSKILVGLFLILMISVNITFLLKLPYSELYNNPYKDDNPKLNAPDITIITPDNITYTGPMSGFYPATFGFENELEGTSGTIIDYVDYTVISSGCEVKTYDNYQGHNKVLRVHDGNANGNAEAQYYFSSTHTTGTIEWWWCTPMMGSGFVGFYIHEGLHGTRAGTLRIKDNNFNDMENNTVLTCNTNQWYHNKLIFDTTTDSYDWYIDGILRVDDGHFENPVNNVGSTNIKGAWANTGSCYVDAVSYSWDSNYNVGDNLEEGLLLSFDISFSPDSTGFSLDGQISTTISGNTTIPLPDDGLHTIQVFGNNSIGENYESDLRYFTIEIMSSEPSEPIIHSYNIWILVGIISIASIITISKRFRK